MHAKFRRYQSPDEYPFTNLNLLPKPILPLLQYPQTLLHKNDVNLNQQLLKFYTEEIIPRITAEQNIGTDGDDQNYGSSSTRDVECLQALSRRVHFGKFIAEAKYLKHPQEYKQLILNGDRDGLMTLLTDQAVEERLLSRLFHKARMYGADLNTDGNIVESTGNNCTFYVSSRFYNF